LFIEQQKCVGIAIDSEQIYPEEAKAGINGERTKVEA
jgi:hypothetical protein